MLDQHLGLLRGRREQPTGIEELDMCVGMLVDMCMGMYINMCTGMCMDSCMRTCIDVCIDMCADMCMDMCAHMYRDSLGQIIINNNNNMASGLARPRRRAVTWPSIAADRR